MKEIVLIRHGKPQSAHNDRLTAGQFTNWVRQYNHSLLDSRHYPPTRQQFNDHHVISSPLKRAKLSALYYTGSSVAQVIPELKEMDIPYYKFPIRLRAWHWVLLNRFVWICGKAGRFESFVEAKQRVVNAVNKVETISTNHQKILIFGHGMSNRYMRIFLTKRGWRLIEKSNEYWGVTRLIKD